MMAIVRSQQKKQFVDFGKGFGYETQFKRALIYDAVAMLCEDGA